MICEKQKLTIRCSDAGLREIHRAIENLGNTQVSQHQTAVAKHEHVLRLEVSVQHLVRVHVVQTQGQLHEPVQNLALREEVLPRCFDL